MDPGLAIETRIGQVLPYDLALAPVLFYKIGPGSTPTKRIAAKNAGWWTMRLVIALDPPIDWCFSDMGVNSTEHSNACQTELQW